VRFVGVLFVLATAGVAQAKPSNPAFLGIGMHDIGGQSQATTGLVGPCIIDTVTRGSGAKVAGLRQSDVIISFDGTRVANCDAVLHVVQGHESGDRVKIEILRANRPMTVTADLWSRDEIMRRRLVGQPIVATDLFGVDDQRSVDLSDLRGKTAIVGWYDVRHCDGCNQVFGKLAAWTRAQGVKTGVQPMSLAVTQGAQEQAKQLTPIGLDVPLALADQQIYEELTVPDGERINFMVIDCRGVVAYVAPIAPNGDDTDAAIDELFAAAEQASRRSAK
jgi:hypothetical protein